MPPKSRDPLCKVPPAFPQLCWPVGRSFPILPNKDYQMKIKTSFANTPQYVLKSGNQPIYPTIKFDALDTTCICVYGFSDKPLYDEFINNASRILTPYPLVKLYLANQIAEANSAETNGVCLSLVILDATDPAQHVVSVATMSAVLLALQEKAMQVPVEFELGFDPVTVSYQVKKRDSKGTLPHEPKYIVQ